MYEHCECCGRDADVVETGRLYKDYRRGDGDIVSSYIVCVACMNLPDDLFWALFVIQEPEALQEWVENTPQDEKDLEVWIAEHSS